MSSFGRLFRVTTFGESHCKGVGAIIDGVPPGLELTEADIQPQLTRRRPGQSKLTTPRDEKDTVVIQSGTERGVTLGTPISVFVPNENVRPQDYSEMSNVPRPGHADYTYQMKYGTRASSGGGRASARETIGRVAAGAIAEKWLKQKFDTQIVSWVSSIGHVDMPMPALNISTSTPLFTREDVDRLGTLRILQIPGQTEAEFVKSIDLKAPAYLDTNNVVYNRQGDVLPTPANLQALLTDDLVPVRCPHPPSACAMATVIRECKADADSIGGTVTCVIRNAAVGWGEPCFDKMQAMLAHAMLSLPAVKGFQYGSGFEGTRQRGSTHNDAFCTGSNGRLNVVKNDAGGVLGGITSGADIYFKIAVKAVSTIGQAQDTVDFDGNSTVLEAKGRHDPCVLPRVPPLVESMSSLVLADLAMLQLARENYF
ncbi:chorismate synthase [Thraustotheca clavata]|uniref:Chorismate synthase n=1 Tax=Thraustotheca clavata TaxID=74557 RepID=A0A1V9ZXL3_9STRA|nr:chorismate synthase [Thraustotheca clavata]